MSEREYPKNKTILVVDDDDSIRFFLKHILEKDGFNVEEAPDGNSAVKTVQSKKIDMIILDWMLPMMSGYEVVKMLQMDEHRSIPVYVVTARVVDQQGIAMIKQEINVVEFMTKPIHHAVFLNKVHQILNTLSPAERKVMEQGRNFH